MSSLRHVPNLTVRDDMAHVNHPADVPSACSGDENEVDALLHRLCGERNSPTLTRLRRDQRDEQRTFEHAWRGLGRSWLFDERS